MESKQSKRISQILKRYALNPIILPRSESWWESKQTFNPGVVYLSNRVHLLYRAIGEDGISRIGYASSKDGYKIDERLDYPVYQHPIESIEQRVISSSGGSFFGAEDPRVVYIADENKIYMTYTLYNGYEIGVALTSIELEDFISKKWRWKNPVRISPRGEAHKNWVIFPKKFNGKYAILHSLSPKIQIAYLNSLEFEKGFYISSTFDGGIGLGRPNSWDAHIRGAAAPPIETQEGWLLLYHATSLTDSEKYKVGAMLLDLKDPTRIIARSNEPLLEPTETYENSGFKPGVVYVTGAVVKEDKLLVYYGASDSYVCVASGSLSELIELLTRNT